LRTGRFGESLRVRQVLFVIGSPRSGSTLLARDPPIHSSTVASTLLTPLAHLGYYAKVDKAPYDAVLAAEAAREFVADLPHGEQDYIDACRAYCDTLYLRMLSTKPEKRLFLDKTPAYALVLDFIARIYPSAKYVVLTRHPLAVFSSYAESFFNGDYAAAQAYNPILGATFRARRSCARRRCRSMRRVRAMVADPARILEDLRFPACRTARREKYGQFSGGERTGIRSAWRGVARRPIDRQVGD
jgi:hypothetical protein